MFLPRLAFVIACMIPAVAAQAHEYWLEAEEYQVQPGEKLAVDLRNGQLFEGTRQAYIENRTTRYDAAFNGVIAPVEARMGDRPAYQAAAPDQDGLLVIAHEAAPSSLTYTEWEKFLTFANHKDFPNAAADHAAAGYSQEKFKETYTRHSKALIAVGEGTGSDMALGLQTELIALKNPYTDDLNGEMAVALTYQDAPRRDAQVEVYERNADSAVTVTKYRTDDVGIARFPVSAGMTYLVDSVVLRPSPVVGETPDSPVWETLWASLTFAVPE